MVFDRTLNWKYLFANCMYVDSRRNYLEADTACDATEFWANQLRRREPHPRQIGVCGQIDDGRHTQIVSGSLA